MKEGGHAQNRVSKVTTDQDSGIREKEKYKNGNILLHLNTWHVINKFDGCICTSWKYSASIFQQGCTESEESKVIVLIPVLQPPIVQEDKRYA